MNPKPIDKWSDQEIRAEIERRATALADLLVQCPTLDLLAHFAFHEEYADPTDYCSDPYLVRHPLTAVSLSSRRYSSGLR